MSFKLHLGFDECWKTIFGNNRKKNFYLKIVFSIFIFFILFFTSITDLCSHVFSNVLFSRSSFERTLDLLSLASSLCRFFNI